MAVSHFPRSVAVMTTHVATANQTVLLTGATVGIGYELAKVFAQEGYNLVLVSRNAERLTSVAEELQTAHRITVKIIASDLSKREAPEEIFAEVQKGSHPVGILVNNAGLGT